MGFSEAVRTCLANYVNFSGRARRAEFWWFALFTVIASLVGGVADVLAGFTFDEGPIGTIAGLALMLPSLAVAIRRLHDIERSGWWYLLVLVPIVGWIVLIYWYTIPGTAGANEYGPDPMSDDDFPEGTTISRTRIPQTGNHPRSEN